MSLRRLAAGVAAGAALVAFGAGSANAAGYAGTLQFGRVTGVPKSVHRGRTITVELWFRQYSPYYVDAYSYGLHFWNPAGVNARGESAPGVTVTWYDSAKKRWVPSDERLNHNSNQIWDVPGRGVMVPSGVWNHQLTRITFASSAKTGLWHFEGEAPQSWSVVTKSGGGTSADLKLNQPPLQQIRVTK
ncbi:hypothetical protein ACWEN3_41510 [Streptomyces sp. NPDC004561]